MCRQSSRLCHTGPAAEPELPLQLRAARVLCNRDVLWLQWCALFGFPVLLTHTIRLHTMWSWHLLQYNLAMQKKSQVCELTTDCLACVCQAPAASGDAPASRTSAAGTTAPRSKTWTCRCAAISLGGSACTSTTSRPGMRCATITAVASADIHLALTTHTVHHQT
jgi:hypothetical protein